MSGSLHCLVFDIETIPDVELGRRLPGLADLEDAAVAEAMFARRTEETGSSFLPYEQHRVVAISATLRTGDELQVWSVGNPESPEDELLRRFFGGLEKLRPMLVSSSGSKRKSLIHVRLSLVCAVNPKTQAIETIAV